MNTWIVEPRDTLVVRDGRPVQEGAPPMRSLDFPWPSTLAGLARTRIGLDEHGEFTRISAAQALAIPVQGPWLARLDEDGGVAEHLMPAPRDCLWHRPEGWTESVPPLRNPPLWERRQLTRLGLPPAGLTDLRPDLQLVGHPGEVPRRKATDGPRFWPWSKLRSWLSAPERMSAFHGGLDPEAPLHERREHVVIDAHKQTASDGLFFSTDGLRFSTRDRERLGVVFRCEHPDLRGGTVFAGGERRISFLREAPKADGLYLPANIDLGPDRVARVILLTPAIFTEGFAPAHFGAGTKVIAAAVGRPEVISGWDFAERGPKPTRRMAPAGSVYWVQLDANEDVQAWAAKIWMKSVSSAPQDRLDGFGLAVVGVG